MRTTAEGRRHARPWQHDDQGTGDARPHHGQPVVCDYTNQRKPEVALMVFTGDALFAGSCGRVDLYGESRRQECAASLYRSLHEKLLPLGDQAMLWPAHGAGSVCGKGISDRDWTTLGYERQDEPVAGLRPGDFYQQEGGGTAALSALLPPHGALERSRRATDARADGPQPVNVDDFARAISGQGATLWSTPACPRRSPAATYLALSTYCWKG